MFNVLAQVNSEFNFETAGEPSAALWIIMLLVFLVILIPTIAGMWRAFTKAGRAGWISIVPFYNFWVLAEIGGQPGWLGLLAALVGIIPLVGPLVSLVISIIIYVGVSNNFGKGGAFSILLLLLPFIGFPVLGFGSATYQPKQGGTGNQPAQPLAQ